MIFGADHPDNHVIRAIRRGNKGRTATAGGPVYIPTAVDGRRIGRSNAKSHEDRVAIVVGAERDIGALFGTIGDGRLKDSGAGNPGDGHGCTDPAKVVSINHIHPAVLTQGDYEMRRRCTGHVHQQWA